MSFNRFIACPKTAFTLAEVLITLGIIGVVAAMTMPSLIANHQKKEAIAKTKKVYSILSQAYQLSQNENGFSDEWIDSSLPINTENVKQYVHKYWLPYLKVIHTCSTQGDCYYVKRSLGPNGTEQLDLEGNNRYTLILADGTLIAFVPFSWSEDKGQYWGASQKFYVDLNGARKPNILGRDVFVFELNLKKHSFIGYGQNTSEDIVNKSCNRTGNGQMCAAKLIQDSWEMKKDYPW